VIGYKGPTSALEREEKGLTQRALRADHGEHRERKKLFAWLVKLDREDASVALKVAISREDRAVSSQGDGANQCVDHGDGDAFTCALIAGLSGSFVVRSVKSNVSKRAKEYAKSFELSWTANT